MDAGRSRSLVRPAGFAGGMQFSATAPIGTPLSSILRHPWSRSTAQRCIGREVSLCQRANASLPRKRKKGGAAPAVRDLRKFYRDSPKSHRPISLSDRNFLSTSATTAHKWTQPLCPFLLVEQQDRNRAAIQDRVRHSTKNEFPQTAASVGTHDDEIGIDLGRECT